MMGNELLFGSAPVSWGVQDYQDAAWEQPWERMLNEMSAAGYSGTELGPYGYFPPDPARLGAALAARGMQMLSAFVPVPLTDPGARDQVLAHIRKVAALLSALQAPLIVVSDAQTPRRAAMAGRIPVDGAESLRPHQWRAVGRLLAEVEQTAAGYGLGVVFHPHVATFVETPSEVARLFDAISPTGIGLCLDTGHCVYGGGDPVEEMRRYRSRLRYMHVKDIDSRALARVRREKMDFRRAVETGVFAQIGCGCLYFPAVLQELIESGYSGWMIVEQDVKYGQTAVTPMESMAASRVYLDEVLRSLAAVAA